LAHAGAAAPDAAWLTQRLLSAAAYHALVAADKSSGNINRKPKDRGIEKKRNHGVRGHNRAD
jgi:hypothetical protein